MNDGVVGLNYAPPGKRRRMRRAFKAVFVLAAIALTLWLANGDWWLWARLRVEMKSAQSRCMNFQAPANQVAIEFDRATAKSLRSRGYQTYVEPGNNSADSGFAFWPAMDLCLRDLYNTSDQMDRIRRAYAHDGSFQVGPFTGASDLGGIYPCVVFLHARKSTAGQRLVAIRVDLEADEDCHVYPMVWKLEGFDSTPERVDPKDRSSGRDEERRITLDPTPLRIFVGTIDAGDESRFTIKYATATGNFTVRGQLMPDDSVQLVDSGASAP